MLAESINFWGHNVIRSNFSSIVDQAKIENASYELKYETKEYGFDKENRILMIVTEGKLYSTTDEKKELFELTVDFQCFFQIESIENIDETTYNKSEWFFKKFIQRSGKQILESSIRHTRFRHVPIPSFVSEN